MFTNFERCNRILFYKRFFNIICNSGVGKIPSLEFDSEKKGNQRN